MHAYLITGSSPQAQIDKLLSVYSISSVNLLTLTPSPSHGIENIREIIHYLTLQTAQKGENRGVLVQDAHLMTEPAQNAFLKTLEEPPPDTIIILTAPGEDLLLPTILSRCVLIPTATVSHGFNPKKEKETFEKLSNAAIGEKVKFTEETGRDREKVLAFVSDQLVYLHEKLHSPNKLSQLEIWSIRNLEKALLLAHNDLSRNVNPKMVLFELLKNY